MSVDFNTPPDLESMWQYRLHQENVFYQRVSQFLIAESMLAVAYTTILPHPEHAAVAYIIILFGLLLTLLWWRANRRQREVTDRAAKYVALRCRWYEQIRKEHGKVWLGNHRIMTDVLPIFVLLLWLCLGTSLYYKIDPPKERKAPTWLDFGQTAEAGAKAAQDGR